MMKKKTVPDYLQSTYDLVTAAFPDGIDRDLYMPLLRFLEEHLSHRNLADLISLVTNRDHALASDDVVDALGDAITDEERAAVSNRLRAHGLDKWLAESWRAAPQ